MELFNHFALDSGAAMKLSGALWMATLQGTLLLGLAFLLTRLMRRASAAQRHMIWLLALGGMLLVPVVSAIVPARLSLKAPAMQSQVRAPETVSRAADRATIEAANFASATFASPKIGGSTPSRSVARAKVQSPASSLQSAAQSVAAFARDRWPIGLLVFYFSGVFLLAMRLLAGLRATRRLERESVVVASAWSESVRETRQLLKIRRPVSIRVAGAENSPLVPLTWGWRRPTILLPRDANIWAPPKQRAVLGHELAHIARGDFAALWLIQIVCALFWFHPLVWLASRAAQAESERATDDWVLAVGVRASEYVECLMEFTAVLSAKRRAPLMAPAMSIGMAQSSTLGNRLLALLDATRNRARPTRWQVAGSLAATTLVLLSVATLTLADETQAPTTQSRAATIAVKGRVLDEAAKPVAGAKIEVYPESVRRDAPLQTTQSDASGEFTVKVPGDLDDYRFVQIEKAGFGIQVGVVDPRPFKKMGTYTLHPPVSLSGLITDEDDHAVPGARVAVRYLTENRSLTGYVYGIETRTDADGKWTLGDLPAGASGEFEIVAPGFARARFSAFLEAKAAPFPAVQLQRGFTATGRVLDVNGNPLAGASVGLRNLGYVTTQTGENGEFTLSGLALTAQELTVDSGRDNQFAPAITRVSPETPRVEIRLQRGISIRGRIINAQTKAPVEGVIVADQMRRGGTPIKSDAAGRFEITLAGPENASLVFQAPAFVAPLVFVNPDQLARRDVGDIEIKPATIWRGKVRLNGKAPGETLFLNLQSPVGSAQLVADENGDFQINSLPSGTYTWTDDVWKWKAVSPQKITVPTPSGKPFILDVEAERLPTQSARGRVINQKGAPVPYATVFFKTEKTTYSATTRADGTWEKNDILSSEKIEVTSVKSGEIALQNSQAKAQKEGDNWRFDDLVLNDEATGVRVQVVDTDGKIAANARVLALWGDNSKFAFTDAQGVAAFKFAPQKVRFLAAKNLSYGESTLDGASQVTIRLEAPRDASAHAEATLSRLIDLIDQVPNGDKLLGDQRLRAAAFKADGISNATPNSTPDWNRAGDNFGKYLSSLVYRDPKAARKEAPVWLEQIKRPETDKPFFLRLAEAEFALLAAKSKDETARAWANLWLDRQLANFGAQVQLKPGWAGGDAVSRYLQGYAVATRLGRREASRFFDAALNALPEDQANSGSYSFPEYFAFDDPGAEIFRAELVPEDQVNFQGALGSNVVRENPAMAQPAREAIEKLLADPTTADVRIELRRFARQRTESEILGAQIKVAEPRVAFEGLKAFNSENYYLGSYVTTLAQRALDGGDKPLAREILQFGISKGWEARGEEPKKWAKLKAEVFPASTPAQIEDLRAQAISHLKNGDPMNGNQSPDIGADSKALREVDPALGRLILEAKWTKMQPIKTDPTYENRYEAIALATAMGRFDPQRALSWFDAIPTGGEFDPRSDELTLAVQIIGGARGK